MSLYSKKTCLEEIENVNIWILDYIYLLKRIRICWMITGLNKKLNVFLWTKNWIHLSEQKTEHIYLNKKLNIFIWTKIWTVLSFLNLIHLTNYPNNPGLTLNWNYYWSLQFLLFQKHMLIAAAQTFFAWNVSMKLSIFSDTTSWNIILSRLVSRVLHVIVFRNKLVSRNIENLNIWILNIIYIIKNKYMLDDHWSEQSLNILL